MYDNGLKRGVRDLTPSRCLATQDLAPKMGGNTPRCTYRTRGVDGRSLSFAEMSSA